MKVSGIWKNGLIQLNKPDGKVGLGILWCTTVTGEQRYHRMRCKLRVSGDLLRRTQASKGARGVDAKASGAKKDEDDEADSGIDDNGDEGGAEGG